MAYVSIVLFRLRMPYCLHKASRPPHVGFLSLFGTDHQIPLMVFVNPAYTSEIFKRLRFHYASPIFTAMSSHLNASQRLRNLPAARFGTAGAALPLATDDPHPALTIALHLLWDRLRVFVTLDAAGNPSFVPQSPNQTPLQALETLSSLLVSAFLLSVFLLITSSLGSIRHCSQRRRFRRKRGRVPSSTLVPFPRLSLSPGRRSTLSRLVTSADS